MPCPRAPKPRGLAVARGQEEANNLERSSYRTKHDLRDQSLAMGSVSLKEDSPWHWKRLGDHRSFDAETKRAPLHYTTRSTPLM